MHVVVEDGGCWCVHGCGGDCGGVVETRLILMVIVVWCMGKTTCAGRCAVVTEKKVY